MPRPSPSAEAPESRRRRYLAALGVVVWEPRSRPDEGVPGHSEVAADPGDAAAPVTTGPTRGGPEPASPATRGDRDAGPPAAGPDRLGDPGGCGSLDLPGLERAVASCARCALHEGRTRTVFGVGDPRARCMVVGEGPGADEDRQGEPFVGRAGRLLNLMLQAIGLSREDVYIANIVKCRPPGNRDPRPDEVAECTPYLRRQVELIRPEIIVAVGRVAAQNLLGSSAPLARLRGTEHRYPHGDVPVLVTYHPAYLLRSPLEKRRAWEDLKRVRARLGGGAA